MIKQAIIPLAGLGTRLLPLTSIIPKELLPINGKPGLEYVLDECIDAGVNEIIFIESNLDNYRTIPEDKGGLNDPCLNLEVCNMGNE